MRLHDAPAGFPIALALGLSLMTASRADAKIKPPKLDEMIRASERIVVARVRTQAVGDANGKPLATADVTETWKGEPAKTVEFRAVSASLDDISKADPGEDVLLFLRPEVEGGGWEIDASGRGRMPLQTMNGRTYATLYLDVTLPAGLDASRHCSDQPGYDRTIELDTLREFVTRAIQAGK